MSPGHAGIFKCHFCANSIFRIFGTCVPEQRCQLKNLEEIDLDHENKMTERSEIEEKPFLT